jgi:triosephosphate isomerase
LIAHDHGDAALAVPILYGGSVSPETVEGLLAHPDIHGALVGGASLNVSTLVAILERAARTGVHGPKPSLPHVSPSRSIV